jgi:hypothetical protein
MKVTVTCLPFYGRWYSVDCGTGVRLLDASQIELWLLNKGAGASTIATVLDFSPNQTMTVNVADEAA